ncbi:hypothetical protein L1049_025202 [Liquidambar formosana]|uniref:LOB domain-containing protein n=1 Tax=Liquidambar formosana TaxID=63359 RepID=A0AAP0WYZ6_LIQFO
MSCNGCRVLRKGCSESCILRPCLQWIESPEAQGHATVFVAKFFGRAGLMSFISAVPENQRPALFQSLLFEACGRTVNPVNGAVGLLWSGNWHVCQAAVETVLRGGALQPLPDLLGGVPSPESDDASEVTCTDMWKLRDPTSNSQSKSPPKRKRYDELSKSSPADLDLRLTPSFPTKTSFTRFPTEKRRAATPSMNSEESVTTTSFESGLGDHHTQGGDRKLLNLFV